MTRGLNRVDEVMTLIADGYTHRQVAERLGMTRNAVELVARRQRAKGDTRTSAVRGPADIGVWEKLYVGPPPDLVACADATPQLFDIPVGIGANIIRARGERTITPRLRQQVGVALAYCESCPLATRQWCLESVRPREGGASLIAGGVVFSNGAAIWTIDDHRRLEARRAEAAA